MVALIEHSAVSDQQSATAELSKNPNWKEAIST
jgi:hypothetical protein